MGIVNKEEAMYMSAGIGITGLKEEKQEVLDVLQSLMQEVSAMDAFGGISMAAAAAFTEAAAGLHALSQEFDRMMEDVGARFPEVEGELESFRDCILHLMTELPVGAAECARALEEIVRSGKRGEQAMELLGEAARAAVTDTKSLTAALEQVMASGQTGGGDQTGGLQSVLSSTEAQLQLLQSRMLVMLRPLGEQLMRQVSGVAAGLGQALSGGNIGGSLEELNALLALATAALRDYQAALEDGTGAVTAEATALDMAAGIREAYRGAVEAAVDLKETEILQQTAYRGSLSETMALEGESGSARLAFAREAIGVGQQLGSIVAEEVIRLRRKKEAYNEELQVWQGVLQAAEEELAQAGELREARQKEYEVLKWGNDETAAALAGARLQKAAELETAAAVGVDSARREVRNVQLKLETVNRQAATASVVANTVATKSSAVADTTAAASVTLLARAKQAATLATRSLTAALAANPLGMVLTVVSLAITAFSAFGRASGKTADEQERLNEVLKKQGEDLRNLSSTLFDESGDDLSRAEALLKLKELLPQVYDKVELANLAEQDRNRLLREGNRELNRRKELELEAMQAASRRRMEELKKNNVTVMVGGAGAAGYTGTSVGTNEGALKKEQEHYRKIGEELERIHTLNAMTKELGLTKQQRLERYRAELADLQERLQEVNTQLQLMYGEQAGQKSFNPEAFPGAKDLLQEKQDLENKISVTSGYAGKLEKPGEQELRQREQMEQQLSSLVEKMMLRRQKEAILNGKKGIDQKLALIRLEYEQQAKEITEKEKQIEGLYGKGKVPEKTREMIRQLRADNEEQKVKKETQARVETDVENEKLAAEAKKHIEEQKEAFLSAEGQKLKAIEERYKEELALAEKYKAEIGDDKAYEDYTTKLKIRYEAEKQAVMFPDVRDFDTEEKNIRQKWTDKKQAVAENTGLVAMLDAAEQEEIKKLNAEKVINSEDWITLFSQLDELTVSEINRLITIIEEQMASADLLPVDRNALLRNLDEAKQQVIATNPFRALGTSFRDVFVQGGTESKKSSVEIEANWKRLGKSTQGCFDFINQAVSDCSVLGDLIGESGQASIFMAQGITSAGIAMSEAVTTAEKSSAVLAVVSAALQAVTALFSVFNKDKKKEAKIQSLQAGIGNLERAYSRLGNAIDHTYSDKAFSMMDQQNENLRQQQELIRQQIAAEQSKKKTDNSKIAEWQNQLTDIDEQLAENQRKRIEMLAGTDVKSAIDEFADALVDAYARGEDGAVALAETTKKVMANAVKEALKRRFLGDQIEEAVTYLGNAMSDGYLADYEKNSFQGMVEAAGQRFSEALKVYDDLFAGDEILSEGGVTGQLQEAMTEGTANQLVGLWNMTANDIRSLRNLTTEQLTLCSMMNLNVGEVLRQQYQIEANTRRTADNTAMVTDELRSGFIRLEGRLKTIDENTKGYTGRGK